jgi:hypothetical protein
MDVFFLDDSESNAPSRPGMRPMVAAGGIYVPSEALRALENELDAVCRVYEFPEGEEFKWSPGRELWMRSNLIEDNRNHFFRDVLNLARDHDGQGDRRDG